MTDGFSVRFWGVRGSIPTPGPATARYGGNTTCIEVRCGDHLIIIDAGSGIRALGQALEKAGGPVTADLFLTHTHYDHISGLPFFGPAYVPGSRITLWEGHLGPGRTLKSVLEQLMSAPLFPVPVNLIDSACRYRKFHAGEVLEPRPGIVIRTAPLIHPNEATGYRIEYGGRVICIVTDTEHPAEGQDANVVDLVRGADLMIYDSTYSDDEYDRQFRGWGHSTWQEALRVGEAAGVKRVVLFHHEPGRSDCDLDCILAEAQAIRPGTIMAAEGAVLTV